MPFPLSAWTDNLPEGVREHADGPAGIAALAVIGLISVYVFAKVAGKLWLGLFGKGPKDSEAALREDLTEYPPPPGQPGPRRLTIEGVPARLRLVVIAPVGKGRPIESDMVTELLNGVVRGLGDIAKRDKPRVRFWPPQLSNAGFAASFHRLTETGVGRDEPSYWVLAGGPANAAGRPILLGLACLADEPNEIGNIVVTADRWAETVRLVTLEK